MNADTAVLAILVVLGLCNITWRVALFWRGRRQTRHAPLRDSEATRHSDWWRLGGFGGGTMRPPPLPQRGDGD